MEFTLFGMHFTAWQFFGHAAFALTAFSFYVRDILALRSIAILAGAVGVPYYWFVAGGPNWLVIFWLCVFMVINAGRIAHLLIERKRVRFSEIERELYETVFRNFSPVEFMKLMRVGEWREAEPGEVLAIEGREIDDLKLIYNGEVVIEKAGREVARSRDGTLIGEMSYIQGGAATATVRAARPTRYIAWPKEALRRLMRRNPVMDVAMRTVFSMDLMKKLGGAPVATGT